MVGGCFEVFFDLGEDSIDKSMCQSALFFLVIDDFGDSEAELLRGREQDLTALGD